jgi:hypothetical protein
MPTDLLVCLIITVFVGMFQFGVSRLLRPSPSQSKREQAQAQTLRMWGYRALVFMIVFIPLYWIRMDNIILVILVYLGLVFYNSHLLKSQIRKVNATYPVEIKKQSVSLSQEEQTSLLDENPLIIDELNQKTENK